MIHRDDKEPIEGIIVKESKSVKATEAPISETFHGLVLEEDAEPVQVEVIDQNLPNSENEKSAAQLPARFVPARENQTQQSQSQSQQQRQDTGHALKTYSRNITINES